MIELLAQVDPFAGLMACLWLFAAGMFPAGFMLGATCSDCCIGPCDLCTEGTLPNTLTVTFSGMTGEVRTEDFIVLSVSSCFGSGAAARVTAPGGDRDEDKGPISAVSVTNGGSGYAKLGRIAPTLTISGGSGTGATFTPTLTNYQDECGLDYWSVTELTPSGGTGYVEGETVTVEPAAGDTVDSYAYGTIVLKRFQPTLSIAGDADLTINYTNNNDGTWSIASVTVNDGGSVYTDGDPLEIELGDGDILLPPGGAALVGRVTAGGALDSVDVDFGAYYYRTTGEPDSVTLAWYGVYYRESAAATPYVSATVNVLSQSGPSAGSGANLIAVVDDDPSSETFGEITGVTVEDGGDGYLAYETLKNCVQRWDGRSVVVRRVVSQDTSDCVYAFQCEADNECGLERELLTVSYNGPGNPMGLIAKLQVLARSPGGQKRWLDVPGSFGWMLSGATSQNCADIDVTAVGGGQPSGGPGVPANATAQIEAGGVYSETPTCRKMLLEDYDYTSVDIEWNGFSWTASTQGGTVQECSPESPYNYSALLAGGCGPDAGIRIFAAADCPRYEGVSSYTYFDEILLTPGLTVPFGYEPSLPGADCRPAFLGGNFIGVFHDSVPNLIVRWCIYHYQIIPALDEDGFPSGQAEVLSLGFVSGGSTYEENELGIPPCSDPGPPSITFSRLP